MSLAVQIVFDCHDADKLAAFWAVALDYVHEPPPPGFDSWPAFLEANNIPVPEQGSINAVIDPDGVGPRLLFQRVPEGKAAKNRIHLDVRAGGTTARDAKVKDLIAAGGTEVTRIQEFGSDWVVMTDPEGNELCVTTGGAGNPEDA